ncbi:MAG: hypothetical protein GTO14_12770 [Anaerolineales bacterium]|nr:hypothetical protein [Anaerolineales bacterium]
MSFIKTDTKEKKHLGLRIALIGLMSLILTACGASIRERSKVEDPQEVGQIVPVNDNGQYVDILAQELDSMLEKKDFFFANVHIPYEGEIPDTDAFIPFDQVAEFLDAFPEDKDAKIVLYCRSGSMSATSARELVNLGFTNVYNLDGGFRAWSAAGYDFIAPE